MPTRQIADESELDQILTRPEFLLFKHSKICPISARAYERYEAFLEGHPELETAWLDVIAQRSLSQAVAQRLGVRHESPQALLVRAGAVSWHSSHEGITGEAIERALAGTEARGDQSRS